MSTPSTIPTDHVWTSLADVTGDPLDKPRKIPDEGIHILEHVFDGRRVVEAPVAGAPPGSLGLLLRGTTIVVRLVPLGVNLAKAVVGAAAVFVPGNLFSRVGGAIGIGEALTKLKSCIARLNPDAGQMCTYMAVVQAGPHAAPLALL